MTNAVSFELVAPDPLDFELSAPVSLGIEIPGFAIARGLPEYTGPVNITPSSAAQVLATKDTGVYSDITIAPIPSNYGLITWDGSVLMVS